MEPRVLVQRDGLPTVAIADHVPAVPAVVSPEEPREGCVADGAVRGGGVGFPVAGCGRAGDGAQDGVEAFAVGFAEAEVQLFLVFFEELGGECYGCSACWVRFCAAEAAFVAAGWCGGGLRSLGDVCASFFGWA